MKILIDIGHPAHVHYFKNFIKIMKGKGHEFLITARNKECTYELLDSYGISFKNRGYGSDSLILKVFYLAYANTRLFLWALKFKPDMFLSFASPYAAQVSKLMGRVHVAFDDTEHAKIAHKLYRPFTDRIFVSKFYLGERTQRMQEYDGLIELSYLHPDYFEPDPLIFDLLGIEQDEKFVFLRFISWGAHHDVGQKGISEEVKLKAVRELRQHAKVFISSESELPEELKPYQLKIPPHMIHHVLYYSSLYFGESGTMATEAAILGTPTIRVSTLAKLLGNFKELSEKYNLLEFYDSDEKGLKRALELVRDEGSKAAWKKRSEAFVKEKVDVVAFMLANITKVEKNG